MLQLAHRTRAPRSCRVSISTAVCTVMCNDPAIRAPRSGFSAAYRSRRAINPGISFSASAISLRPNAANPGSATRQSPPPALPRRFVPRPAGGRRTALFALADLLIDSPSPARFVVFVAIGFVGRPQQHGQLGG